MANAVFVSNDKKEISSGKWIEVISCDPAGHSATEIAGGYDDFLNTEYPTAAGWVNDKINPDSVTAICTAAGDEDIAKSMMTTITIVFWRGRLWKLTTMTQP